MIPEEKELFMEELGLTQSGLDRLVQGELPAAGAFKLPHRRGEGGPGLDHPPGEPRPPRPPG